MPDGAGRRRSCTVLRPSAFRALRHFAPFGIWRRLALAPVGIFALPCAVSSGTASN